MKRREFLALIGTTVVGTAGCITLTEIEVPPKRPNILLLTADDMNFDSLGFQGCPLPDISPNLDQLAAESFRFEHAHVVSTICGPSRGALHTGRYPHQTGSMGHGEQPPSWWEPRAEIPSLSAYLHSAGYRTGIISKGAGRAIEHVFDLEIGKPETDVGRSPAKHRKHCLEFFNTAKANDQPFFLNANMCDPHQPWARQEGTKWLEKEQAHAEAVGETTQIPDPKVQYDPAEIPVPPFLIDTEETRKEIAPYYDSVNRMDECVGAILDALREAGMEKNTLIIFISDHGMGVTFAKRSNYLFGTKTPLIIKWPGVLEEGRTDDEHVVSTADLTPTFIEAAGLPPLKGIEGRSLLPIMKSEPPVGWRKAAYAAFNCMNGEEQYWPSRAMSGRKYLYLWNAWVDGKLESTTVLHSGRKHLDSIKKRWGNDWQFGIVEEFYDIEADPGYWTNLINNNDHKEIIAEYRKLLLDEMIATQDPELEKFRKIAGG